jgi:hypothetical protein
MSHELQVRPVWLVHPKWFPFRISSLSEEDYYHQRAVISRHVVLYNQAPRPLSLHSLRFTLNSHVMAGLWSIFLNSLRNAFIPFRYDGQNNIRVASVFYAILEGLGVLDCLKCRLTLKKNDMTRAERFMFTYSHALSLSKVAFTRGGSMTRPRTGRRWLNQYERAYANPSDLLDPSHYPRNSRGIELTYAINPTDTQDPIHRLSIHPQLKYLFPRTRKNILSWGIKYNESYADEDIFILPLRDLTSRSDHKPQKISRRKKENREKTIIPDENNNRIKNESWRFSY